MAAPEFTEEDDTNIVTDFPYAPTPYWIGCITLWAVECCHRIDRYCDTEEQAQKHCDRLNK